LKLSDLASLQEDDGPGCFDGSNPSIIFRRSSYL
jgi:hypothetical protein